jgi:two-component system, sensor histidine kinase and response regulator
MSETPIARLLVVDDEAPLVAALQSTLVKQGYAVVGLTSAREALAHLRTGQFEVLLTDLEMAEMSGIDLLRAALEIDRRLMPIIMTGHGTIETAVEAMKSGAFDYILKPFKLSVVVPALSRALAVRRLRLENEALQQHLRIRTTELERANKELEAFSYSVSHDLRAPLRAIGGFTGLLDKRLTPQSSEVGDLMARIQSSVARMNALIEDLLSLAKAARAPVHRRSVDLTAMAREIAAKLQADTPDRRIDWTILENLRASGDPGLLRVVLENLLANAWKYTGKTAHAHIEVGVETQPDHSAAFYVRDNGAGFDMKYADRLFGAFQRLHTEQEFAGTGVGLATVQRIVHKHGGRIWAEAELDRGAIFRFTLPG